MARRGKFNAGQPVHIVNAVGTPTNGIVTEGWVKEAGRFKGCIEIQTVGGHYGPQPIQESEVIEGWVA